MALSPLAAARSFLRQQLLRVASGLRSLSSSPSELWKAYALKFLDSHSCFSFSIIFTIFLRDLRRVGRAHHRLRPGHRTVIDNLGVAKCLRIGFALSLLSRIAIFAASSRGVLLASLLVALPFANYLGIPVLTVGMRRYTDNVNRGLAFGLFYCVMNVGALVAGPLVDALTMCCNRDEGDEEGGKATSSEWRMTANRAITLSGVVANVIAMFVAFTVREIKVDPAAREGGEGADDRGEGRPLDGDGDANARKVSEFRPTRGSAWRILSETAREPDFRRFLLVCLLTLNVRMVFRHLDGTLPKYMVREFGENTPKGRVYAINPAMIIVLVPIVTAATTAVDPLIMIHRGTYISAISVFFLAFSTSLPACVLFVITLSIGEAIWSPRLYDYTMSIAKEGREGTYMALSSAPLFLAKLPVGFLSGLLLQRYCPEHLEEGEVRHSKTMWWIIGLSTIVSPILITLLWGYISGGEERGVGGEDAGMANGDGTVAGDQGVAADDLSEHSYQCQPLTSKISLPKVRPVDRPLV